jgi:chromosome segregation ATPase
VSYHTYRPISGAVCSRTDSAGQKQHLSSLNTKLNQVEAENVQLRESKEKWEQDRRLIFKEEQELRNEIHVLNDQLERARRDME